MRFSQVISIALTAVGLFFSSCSAQLSGSVGPTTSTASKASKKICSVLDYGAKADNVTDIGPPLASAFAACKTGGIVWIPSGDYAMATWQVLRGGSGWAIQLDGIIYRTGTAGGHMIIVKHANDFEFFSRTSQGAMQGYGYYFHSQGLYGPRLIRLVNVTNFSLHDIKLVDSGAFHLVVLNCQNGEVYNVIIRGGDEGGLDGIDVSGSNIWIHDVEVTNKDECVTIKSPASNMRIENIYCNWSGGCAIGSLGSGAAISNIEYYNVYAWQSNHMFLIKTGGGNGYVKDCSFTNFIGHSVAYGLYINQYWASRVSDPGNGVQLSNLNFSNWQGIISNGKRASVDVACADTAPCTGIALTNLSFWTNTNAMHYFCESAYGSGYCIQSSGTTSYTTATSVTIAPSGYNGAKMPSDLASGFALNVSIPIPATIPTSFYPGVSAKSALRNGRGGGAGTLEATLVTTTKASAVSKTSTVATAASTS